MKLDRDSFFHFLSTPEFQQYTIKEQWIDDSTSGEVSLTDRKQILVSLKFLVVEVVVHEICHIIRPKASEVLVRRLTKQVMADFCLDDFDDIYKLFTERREICQRTESA